MLPTTSRCVHHGIQIQYTRLAGLLVGQGGKLRPATFDEVEQAYGQRMLENVLCASPEWVKVEQPEFPAVLSRAFEPLPTLHPITTAVRKINWSAFGLSEPVTA